MLKLRQQLGGDVHHLLPGLFPARGALQPPRGGGEQLRHLGVPLNLSGHACWVPPPPTRPSRTRSRPGVGHSPSPRAGLRRDFGGERCPGWLGGSPGEHAAGARTRQLPGAPVEEAVRRPGSRPPYLAPGGVRRPPGAFAARYPRLVPLRAFSDLRGKQEPTMLALESGEGLLGAGQLSRSAWCARRRHSPRRCRRWTPKPMPGAHRRRLA